MSPSHQPPTPAVIWDIDGVLADSGRRIQRLKDQQKAGTVDWEAFHADQLDDPIMPGWGALLRLLAPSCLTILLTNRSERYRDVTQEWLAKGGLPYDMLLMRGDVPGDRNSKAIHLDELIRNEDISIQLAIDDDPGHDMMYFTRGIPFVYAHSGYYEGSEYVTMTAKD